MIIPSIDIMNNKAVQLRQGKEKVLEEEKVRTLAESFAKVGEIAVIDLDAAMNRGNNRTLINELARTYPVRVGGGIRNIEKALEVMRSGAQKIIIGSAALTKEGLNTDFLRNLKKRIGRDQIIIALDIKGEMVFTQGWHKNSGISYKKLLSMIPEFANEVLITDIDVEGTMSGINREKYLRIADSTNARVTAAGGVGSLEDISFFADLGFNVQLGMSLYTGTIDLESAFVNGLAWKNELLPTITRDTNGNILMVAYSNKESLKKSIQTGLMWYYSRSRKRLWQKGETSGNIQQLVGFKVDCDNDAIIATVRQINEACHTNKYSCFDDRPFSLNELYELIGERIKHAPTDSYTATLTDEKLKAKILEEAAEVTDFSDRENLIWEISDLLYFISVMMVKQKISWEEILFELRRRKFK